MGRLIAYARVSTNGQTLDAQVEALEAAGAEVIFRETASGTRTDRTQLAKAIGALGPFDLDPCAATAFPAKSPPDR